MTITEFRSSQGLSWPSFLSSVAITAYVSIAVGIGPVTRSRTQLRDRGARKDRE